MAMDERHEWKRKQKKREKEKRENFFFVHESNRKKLEKREREVFHACKHVS
jgi:hypothetical protein